MIYLFDRLSPVLHHTVYLWFKKKQTIFNDPILVILFIYNLTIINITAN